MCVCCSTGVRLPAGLFELKAAALRLLFELKAVYQVKEVRFQGRISTNHDKGAPMLLLLLLLRELIEEESDAPLRLLSSIYRRGILGRYLS